MSDTTPNSLEPTKKVSVARMSKWPMYAVLLAGLPAIRSTPVKGSPRLPYCMMGVCFDCLAEIDGVANRQSCMVTVAPGMRIVPQQGARRARPG